MPNQATVLSFMDAVESGDFVTAIERYYHADASIQENNEAPRVGRALLVKGEQQFLESMVSVSGHRMAPPLIEGDHVAIRWRFDIRTKDGKELVLEEIAFQTWQGNRIREETFFYDPKQVGR
nr:nuclear transport factor 2 family protein [Luteibacter rhizovicinus]